MMKIIRFIPPVLVVIMLIFIGSYLERPLLVVYAVEDSVENSEENSVGGNLIEKPVNPYSYRDGFLKIDISKDSPLYPGYGEGLSPDSIYVFEDIFEIENNVSETGADIICVTITSDSPEIALFINSFEGIWFDEIEFTVESNSSVKVGMVFNTGGLELGDIYRVIGIKAYGGVC